MINGLDCIGITIVFFCHDGDGNYLFARRGARCRDENGRWDTGGGGLEFDGKVEEVLRKEVNEEYCTDVIEHEFLGYRDVHRIHNGIKTHWIALDFRILVDRDKVKIGEPHKFDEIGWYKLTNLPSPLHSQLPNALKKYKEKL